MKHLGVSAVEVSDNRKIGRVSATYVSQRTCHSDCIFRGAGCYAEGDLVKFTTNRVNRQADEADLSIDQLSKAESDAIDALTGRFPLRLHVVGDCPTDKSAKVVAGAASRYQDKHNQKVWSYTHAWRHVKRSSWGEVSILASCETTADIVKARKRGYATAIVVAEHKSDKAYRTGRNQKLVPCPQQTGRAANCEACKLCWNAVRLYQIGVTIAFSTHSSGKAKANAALVQIGGVK